MSLENSKAAAIMEFVDLMIGALESGFIDKNTLTIAQLHRVAQNHVKDNYGVEYSNIIERHGKDIAKQCGLEIN